MQSQKMHYVEVTSSNTSWKNLMKKTTNQAIDSLDFCVARDFPLLWVS